MKVVVGLGNPEKKYDNTYHNLGFRAIDEYAKIQDVTFSKKMCNSLIAQTYENGEKIFLLKPLTYMNLSGIAVKEFCNKFKIPYSSVFVFVDDIDLPLGTVRYRQTGSGGTHNGLKSIVEETDSTEFRRIKIGVGRDPKFKELADYVVSNIPKDRQEIIESEIKQAVELLKAHIGE